MGLKDLMLRIVCQKDKEIHCIFSSIVLYRKTSLGMEGIKGEQITGFRVQIWICEGIKGM